MSEELIAALYDKVCLLETKIAYMAKRTDEIRSLVGPFAVTFPNGSMLTQTLHGVKFFIDPEDMVIAPQMVVYRQWEADLSNLFIQLCNPDTVIVDVGANFGYFTILAASRIGLGGSGKVYSFEPNPKMAKLVRLNMEVNWSIAPVEFLESAVAENSGDVVLHVPMAHGANASLSAPEDFQSEAVSVKSVRLDDVIPSDVKVDLMKVDVEGHELAVLRGAQEVIRRSPNLHLVIEWSRKQMHEAGVDPREIISLLEDFTPYKIELGSAPLDHPVDFEWLMGQAYADVLLKKKL